MNRWRVECHKQAAFCYCVQTVKFPPSDWGRHRGNIGLERVSYSYSVVTFLIWKIRLKTLISQTGYITPTGSWLPEVVRPFVKPDCPTKGKKEPGIWCFGNVSCLWVFNGNAHDSVDAPRVVWWEGIDISCAFFYVYDSVCVPTLSFPWNRGLENRIVSNTTTMCEVLGIALVRRALLEIKEDNMEELF